MSYSQRNLFGLGQRLVASAKLGQVGAPTQVLGLVGAPSFCRHGQIDQSDAMLPACSPLWAAS